MRYIEKKPLPEELQHNLNQALQNNFSWKEFSSNKADIKQALREHLKAEQSGLCAYSEISLSEFSFHLDHIKPKGIPQYAQLQFNAQNLLASSPKNQGDIKCDDLFGGHKKANQYDAWFISPTDKDCERYFQYSPNGDIKPKNGLSDHDADRAKKTIDCLGLQSSRLLVNKRKRLYQMFNKQLKFLLDQPETLQSYRDYYSATDENGHLKPFQSIIKQIFSELEN